MQRNVPSQAAPVSAAPQPVHWSPLTRFAFRCAFLYFCCFLFCFGNGTLFSGIPWLGGKLDRAMTWPLNHVAEWAAVHLFHVTGVGAHFHPTGSGDTAVQWVLEFVFVVTALAGALVWTALAQARGARREEYQMLYAWLRFLLRLTCGMFMLSYGADKLFPFQMAPISIAILNEPVGNMSPMTMLWALIGLHPGYEVVCGAAEVLGGVLILFRRTALLGALVSSFVMTNVLLYNLFFDVPVKLFAANLLLALLFICLPDGYALYSFFWLHRPAAPAGIWVPPLRRKSFRIATLVVEIAFVAMFLLVTSAMEGHDWYLHVKTMRAPDPLFGAWRLDPAYPASGAFLDPEHRPITDLYVDNPAHAFTRSADGELWRTSIKLDAAAHTVRLACYTGEPTLYSFSLPDPDHLVLQPVAAKSEAGAPGGGKGNGAPASAPATLILTRVPVPSRYPLLERGFHWVNEWGLER